MHLSRFLRAFVLSFVLFLLLDGFWHGGVMANFYGQRLLFLNPALHGQPGAFSPFMLFVAAINAVALSWFVLEHMKDKKPFEEAVWIGGLLGFTVTGSINFLNHSLLAHWDIVMAWVDTAWGTATGIIVALAVAVTVPARKKKATGIMGMMKKV